MENIQTEEIRKKIEALIKEPEFEKMSEALKASIKERLDIKDLELKLRIQTPVRAEEGYDYCLASY